MNSRYMFSLIAVIVLFLIAWAGAAVGLQFVFGIIIPYLALITFLVGLAYKVVGWSRSAVPFRIPTTGGQQKSLPWIKHSQLDCPATNWQVIARMALEILTFRSLFRNTRMRLKEGTKLSYQLEIFLWVGALAFHYAFLAVIIRHLRFFTEPVPFFVTLVENVDSFFRLEILYPNYSIWFAGGVYIRPCPVGCRNLSVYKTAFYPSGQIYFPGERLFSVVFNFRYCLDRHSHALFH